CTCSNSMVSRYQKRISGPVLDRLVEARFRILGQPYTGQGCQVVRSPQANDERGWGYTGV
ncbi:hypothetical protein ACFLWA_10895, partial [Chloroflexota bacterium]